MVGDFKDVFHTHAADIQSAITSVGLEDRVLLTGFVPDAELVYLYGRAHALVQPSLMEGFGLPVVEAMACGTPVISSRAGSLPEVVGNAGLFFDPTDVASMAATVNLVLADSRLRDELAGRGAGTCPTIHLGPRGPVTPGMLLGAQYHVGKQVAHEAFPWVSCHPLRRGFRLSLLRAGRDSLADPATARLHQQLLPFLPRPSSGG